MAVLTQTASARATRKSAPTLLAQGHTHHSATANLGHALVMAAGFGTKHIAEDKCFQLSQTKVSVGLFKSFSLGEASFSCLLESYKLRSSTKSSSTNGVQSGEAVQQHAHRGHVCIPRSYFCKPIPIMRWTVLLRGVESMALVSTFDIASIKSRIVSQISCPAYVHECGGCSNCHSSVDAPNFECWLQG